ncbi:MAG TPA: hypothetical protein VII75_07610, partial [Thermoanaerobaculia bacterium]
TPPQLEQMLKASPSIVLGLPVPVDAPPAPPRRRSAGVPPAVVERLARRPTVRSGETPALRETR